MVWMISEKFEISKKSWAKFGGNQIQLKVRTSCCATGYSWVHISSVSLWERFFLELCSFEKIDRTAFCLDNRRVSAQKVNYVVFDMVLGRLKLPDRPHATDRTNVCGLLKVEGFHKNETRFCLFPIFPLSHAFLASAYSSELILPPNWWYPWFDKLSSICCVQWAFLEFMMTQTDFLVCRATGNFWTNQFQDWCASKSYLNWLFYRPATFSWTMSRLRKFWGVFFKTSAAEFFGNCVLVRSGALWGFVGSNLCSRSVCSDCICR